MMAEVAMNVRPISAMSLLPRVWVSRLNKMISTVKAQGLKPSARAMVKTKSG